MQLLILNGAVVTLVVLSFLVIRRAPRPPGKLDLREGGKPPSPKDFLRSVEAAKQVSRTASASSSAKPKPVGWDNYTPRQRNVSGLREPGNAAGAATARPMEKSLNIFFNWNGHAWDAYEVLGVPAGASIEMVYAAFERAKTQADRETLPFISAAYEAVVNTYTLR